MKSEKTTRIKVLHSLQLDSNFAVAVQILSGVVDPTTTSLFSEATGEQFNIAGFGFIPAAAYEAGKRALLLKPTNLVGIIKEGDILIAGGE